MQMEWTDKEAGELLFHRLRIKAGVHQKCTHDKKKTGENKGQGKS